MQFEHILSLAFFLCGAFQFSAYLRVTEAAWKSHGHQSCQIKIWWQTHNVIKIDKIDPVFFVYPCVYTIDNIIWLTYIDALCAHLSNVRTVAQNNTRALQHNVITMVGMLCLCSACLVCTHCVTSRLAGVRLPDSLDSIWQLSETPS